MYFLESNHCDKTHSGFYMRTVSLHIPERGYWITRSTILHAESSWGTSMIVGSLKIKIIAKPNCAFC